METRMTQQDGKLAAFAHEKSLADSKQKDSEKKKLTSKVLTLQIEGFELLKEIESVATQRGLATRKCIQAGGKWPGTYPYYDGINPIFPAGMNQYNWGVYSMQARHNGRIQLTQWEDTNEVEAQAICAKLTSSLVQYKIKIRELPEEYLPMLMGAIGLTYQKEANLVL